MLEEIRNILADLRSGALSASDFPGFFGFLLFQAGKFSLVVIFAFAIGYLLGIIH